jgi:hypothetical protein
MIDLQTSGYTVILSLSWLGSIIMFYLIIQISLYFKTKVLPLHRTFLFFRTLIILKRIKPKHWSFTLDNLISPLTISRKNGLYEVFIKTKSNAYDEWTCDWIKVDYKGNILSESLSLNMNIYDSTKKSQILQYNRNKNLKNLGL